MIANYWNNLNEREKWLLAATSICVIIYLFYLFFYAPLANAVINREKLLQEKNETLHWMKQVRNEAKHSNHAMPITNAKLLALIDNQLSNNKLHQFTYQLQQTGSGEIQLSFERVPFNQFLTWLWSVNNNYAFNIKQFNAERSDVAGMVRLNLIIAASN